MPVEPRSDQREMRDCVARAKRKRETRRRESSDLFERQERESGV